MTTEKYLVRHLLSILQALEEEELGNAYWLPGTENPADGMTKVKSEMFPILGLMGSGEFRPGTLRPLHVVGSNESTK